jgi:hypothetical protein
MRTAACRCTKPPWRTFLQRALAMRSLPRPGDKLVLSRTPAAVVLRVVPSA